MASPLCASLADPTYDAFPSSPSRQRLATLSPTTAVDLDYEALFAQFSPLVRRLVHQYGNTPEMREDLFGELYCLFHTFLDRYDSTRGIPLNAYLVRQLTVGCFTFARTQWRRHEHEGRPLQEDERHCASSALDPTSQWDAAMQQRRVAARLPALLKSLPLRQQKVVILRYYEDRSYKEIAQILDVQAATARSLLRHALNRLREQIVLGESMEDLI